METIWRVMFVYAFVWVGFRIVGKRELTQLAPFELVLLLVFPQLFSRALTRQDYSMTNAVIGASTLFLIIFVISAVSHRFPRFGRIVQAGPSVLVARGQFLTEVLNRERISPNDIYSAMHKAGVGDLGEVEWVILEGDGKIAVIPRILTRPVSPLVGDT